MVVLTIVAQKNGETISFAEPIPRVDFVKLISCGLHNSWENLKEDSTVTLADQNGNIDTFQIPAGHYILENIGKALEDGLDGIKYKATKELFSPIGPFLVKNSGNKAIKLDSTLQNFLGVERFLKGKTTVIRKIPESYFIHCSLVSKNENFFNGRKTDLLAVFEQKGRPHEKIVYFSSPQQPYIVCSTDAHVSSITISVKDQAGEMFDFGSMPLEFVLELI